MGPLSEPSSKNEALIGRHSQFCRSRARRLCTVWGRVW